MNFLLSCYFGVYCESNFQEQADSTRIQDVFSGIHLKMIALLNINLCYFLYPRFYVSTSKSIIKALINMHSFEIQLSPIG